MTWDDAVVSALGLAIGPHRLRVLHPEKRKFVLVGASVRSLASGVECV